MSERAFTPAWDTQVKPQPAAVLQRACACGQHSHVGGACEGCKKKRADLQRSPLSLEGSTSTRRIASIAAVRGEGQLAPPIVHEVLRSSGQPLDTDTRQFMESRFDHDFSQVRVHTDSRAAESAQAVNALAYTIGNDIAIGAGQYSPRTSAGKKLLAHELAHIIQQEDLNLQSAATAQQFSIQADTSPLENEADHAAEHVAAGGQAQMISTAPAGSLQRQGRGISDRGQLCGDFSDFLRFLKMDDLARAGYIFPDMVTCLCLGVTGVDMLPIPGIGNNPVVEWMDCLCNVLTFFQELYKRGYYRGCWSQMYLDQADEALLTILGGAVAVDCLSLPVGGIVGGLLGALFIGGEGTAVGPAGTAGGGIAGGIFGASVGDFVLDFVAEFTKNMIIQGVPWPAEQAQACERVTNWLGRLELPEIPPLVGF
jgi:hypothetical protein